MYEAQQLLDTIDQHRWWILGGFAVAMVFQWVWLLDCLRVAKRDGVYSMPLFCTFFWFAHDTGCVARFHEWFVVYDHWFLKLFWCGLLTAVLIELAFFAQVIRYGRTELMPGVGAARFVALLVVVQVASSVCWELFKSFDGDPLYVAGPALTMVSYPLLGAALLLRRRSARGQSVLMWSTFTAMTVAWFATSGAFFGEPFRSWPYLGTGLVAAVGGATLAWAVRPGNPLLSSVFRDQKESDDAHPTTVPASRPR